jgi:small GTP-binding protein
MEGKNSKTNSNKINTELKNNNENNYRNSIQTFSCPSYNFKFVLVGDINVGKTCIKYQFTEGKFDNSYKSTVGVEFKVKKLKLPNKTLVNIEVWDTCGQERFRSITKQYYRDAHGIILVFDITERRTFDHMEDWINDIYNSIPDKSKISFLLVGNKSDLAEKREVNEYEAAKQASKNEMEYIEISAYNGSNINEMFQRLSMKIIDRQEQEMFIKPKKTINYNADDHNNSSLKKLMNSDYKKKSCC